MFTSSGTSQIMSVILGKYVETLKVEREIHSKCGEVKKLTKINFISIHRYSKNI